MQLFSQSSDLIPRWRLTAELLGCLVWRLVPDVQLVGGGVNSLGFFYDFVFRQPITREMLELIEVELHRFIKEEHPVRYLSMMRENAKTLFEHHRHFILAEKAGEEDCNILELLQVGNFYSLCPDLALASTLEAGHVKLLDYCVVTQEENEGGDGLKVTRLLGTSQPHAKELKSFLKTYDAYLKKRDHRLLGPKLNLFSFSDNMGSLGVIWHPKGMALRRILQVWLEQQLLDSPWISTPLAVKAEFVTPNVQTIEPFVFDGREYLLRSSFLRQHLESLKHFSFDVEELPWKVSEAGSVFHFYPESQRWGLLCTCSNFIDQTTVCCKKEQVIQELISSLQFIEQIITIFGFKAQWVLVAGTVKNAKNQQEKEAIKWLRQAYQESGCKFPLDADLCEECDGETPRLELRISDALGREWATSAITMATELPDITILKSHALATDASLVVFTRRTWGSLERFIALLIEHFEGVLPFWLAPEQVRVIAIGEANRDYARELSRKLEQKGLRIKLDLRQSKLSMRIHEAEKENVPYLLLVGEQERLKQKISVRKAGKPNHNQLTDFEAFLKEISKYVMGTL